MPSAFGGNTPPPDGKGKGKVKTEEEAEPGTPVKGSGERNVNGGLQVLLEEDGDGGTKQSSIQTSGLSPTIYRERQGVS